jgi:hypothetical protein
MYAKLLFSLQTVHGTWYTPHIHYTKACILAQKKNLCQVSIATKYVALWSREIGVAGSKIQTVICPVLTLPAASL